METTTTSGPEHDEKDITTTPTPTGGPECDENNDDYRTLNTTRMMITKRIALEKAERRGSHAHAERKRGKNEKGGGRA